MNIGLGLYPNLLTDDNLRFARQLGVTHIVAWMPLPPGTGLWELDDLVRLRSRIESFGLKLAAVENIPPSHWDKILLGDPGREQQVEKVKQTIRNLGKAGIPCLGYTFSIVGVWGHWRDGESGGGRGDAGIKSFDYDRVKDAPPLVRGRIWGGHRWNDLAPEQVVGPVDVETMWERLTWFLQEVVPVAEEAGVKLAAHPDDPPVPVLRGIGRLLTSPEALERLTSIVDSPCNAIEFCQGTVAEMGADVVEVIRRLGSRKKIAYVHFRNVRGAVPSFDEVFIDEGNVDMMAAMRAYAEVGFDGVMIPDHTPKMSCAAPWHAGMAFAVGYMRALEQKIGSTMTPHCGTSDETNRS